MYVNTSEPLSPPAPSAGLCSVGTVVVNNTGSGSGSSRPPPVSHSDASPWQQHLGNPKDTHCVSTDKHSLTDNDNEGNEDRYVNKA